MGMLFLTLEPGEFISLGDDTKVKYVIDQSLPGRNICLGIDAPRSVTILRDKLAKRVMQEKEMQSFLTYRVLVKDAHSAKDVIAVENIEFKSDALMIKRLMSSHLFNSFSGDGTYHKMKFTVQRKDISDGDNKWINFDPTDGSKNLKEVTYEN